MPQAHWSQLDASLWTVYFTRAKPMTIPIEDKPTLHHQVARHPREGKKHAPCHTPLSQFAGSGTQLMVVTCQTAAIVTAATNAIQGCTRTFTASILEINQTRRHRPFGWTPPQDPEPFSKSTHNHHQMDSCSNFKQSTTTNDLAPQQLTTLDNNISLTDFSFIPIPNNISNNYPYTKQLLQLQSHRDNKLPPLPLSALAIVTPLMYEEWLRALASHPDQAFTDYLLKGIASKSDLMGTTHGSDQLVTCTQLYYTHNQWMTTYKHRIAGRSHHRAFIRHPICSGQQVWGHTKAGQPGKWRLF